MPQVIQDYITDANTYSDYHEKYDTTTSLVTGGQRFDEPFPQSELEKIERGEYINEDLSYQPVYVRHRNGDFPSF